MLEKRWHMKHTSASLVKQQPLTCQSSSPVSKECAGKLLVRNTLEVQCRPAAAGRIYSKRCQGKLVFYDLKADGEKIQVMADVGTSGSESAAFVELHNSVKLGDIVGVSGFPGKSKKGELSIFPMGFQVLSPCLHMLPLRRLDNQVGPYLPPAAVPCSMSCMLVATGIAHRSLTSQWVASASVQLQ
jgi:lysyl-tRNA synthetase class II